MKLGKTEGTPEEITDLIENHGLNLEDYFEKIESPLHWKWLAIPGSLFILAVPLLVLFDNLSNKIRILLFLVGAAGLCWAAVSLQIRFKSNGATVVAVGGGLLVLLVAAGFLAPEETVDVIKEFKNE